MESDAPPLTAPALNMNAVAAGLTSSPFSAGGSSITPRSLGVTPRSMGNEPEVLSTPGDKPLDFEVYSDTRSEGTRGDFMEESFEEPPAEGQAGGGGIGAWVSWGWEKIHTKICNTAVGRFITATADYRRMEEQQRRHSNALLLKHGSEYQSVKSLKISVCTWNVAQSVPPEDGGLARWLLGPDQSVMPDIVVVGLQEVEIGGTALVLETTERSVMWLEAITDTLNRQHPKQRYKKLVNVQLVGMVMIVIARSDHLKSIRNVYKAVTRTGAMSGMFGNKGTIGVRATIYGKRFLFMNAHFAAHKQNNKWRNANYHDALTQLKFNLPMGADDETDKATFEDPNNPSRTNGASFRQRWLAPKRQTNQTKTNNSKKLLNSHEYVFLFGDLNYRLVGIADAMVKAHIESNNFEHLLQFDQLRQSMSERKAVNGFSEPQIEFPPTYKFDVNSDTYDTSAKARTPAWTDRILVRCIETREGLDGTPQVTVRRMPRSFTTPDELADLCDSGTEEAATNAMAQSHSSPPASPMSPLTVRRTKDVVPNKVTCSAYDSIRDLRTSDHRPVSAQFEVNCVQMNESRLRELLDMVSETAPSVYDKQ